uniref:Reverse transcriptase domain-containing protein n=1 Tax=Triticum urartu TaxID=4572 RepID=A0A8R7R6G8_TRIUA
MPEMVNSTVLVLIPKVKNPQHLSQYRPISLCSVLYKLASKVLALRLRPLLQGLISKEQSAFVPGRLITDNVLLAYECIHFLKRGKSGACAVKLDMAKAYDRVEWSYLRAIMSKLGFADAWINRVMSCVETVSFPVRVNGNYSQIFKPSKGIRQGDPISPYLFLLCAEGFSCMLKKYGAGHLSRGVRVGIHCPWISHLLFADDCMVFTQATAEGANRLQEVLERYRIGSGQMVNKQKSAIFFSGNSDDNMKAAIHQGTEITVEALVEKYLGLPTALGRSTDENFQHILATIKRLVAGWAPKLLSSAGREVLIKSICQAIPTYSMSCFKLSKKLCKKIIAVLARFWWGGDEKKRKMHWVKWKDLAIPKVCGGMGFKDLVLFNKAMLAKQGWRLICNPGSLCARVLRGKYYHEGNLLTAGNKRNASHTWRAILYGREALKLGLIKRIGDGASTRIWDDPWIPSN